MVHCNRQRVQHLSIRCTELLAESGIEPSVGSRGDSYDSALTESVNCLFETEVIQRRGSWRRLEEFELAVLKWVAWHNHHRLLDPICYLSLAEFEKAHHRTGQAPAEQVGVT